MFCERCLYVAFISVFGLLPRPSPFSTVQVRSLLLPAIPLA